MGWRAGVEAPSAAMKAALLNTSILGKGSLLTLDAESQQRFMTEIWSLLWHRHRGPQQAWFWLAGMEVLLPVPISAVLAILPFWAMPEPR